MSGEAALAARLRARADRFTYPLRDWMLATPGCDQDVALLGTGQRALMLGFALLRERIGRLVLIEDGDDDGTCRLAGCEVGAGLDRFDLTGPELWMPEADFTAFRMAGGEPAEPPAGAALAAAWAAYLRWLRPALGLPVPLTAPSSIDLEGGRVRIEMAGGTAVTARRLVIAGGLADAAPAPRFPVTTLAPWPVAHAVPPDAAGRVLVLGGDAAATELALAALRYPATSVLQIGLVPEASPPARPIHAMADLAARQHAAFLGAPHLTPPPTAWRRRLAGFGGRYRALPDMPDTAAALRALLAAEDARPDLVLTPHPTPHPLAGCQLRLPDGSETTLGTLAGNRLGMGWEVLAPDRAPLPLHLFGTAALSHAGPRAAAPHLARYGVMDLLRAVGRAFFLEDEAALFAEFLDFRTAEGLGGTLGTETR